MAKESSPQDVEKQHLEWLGEKAGEIYHVLYNQSIWLRITWNQYRNLYGGPKKNVDVLNSSPSSLFFVIAQRSILFEISLCLCRMTDFKESAGRPNVSLDALTAAIEDEELKSDIAEQALKARNATQFARKLRNKIISHTDRDHALGRKFIPWPGLDIVEAGIHAIEEPIKKVYEHFGASLLADRVITRPGSGSDILVQILELGNAERKRRRRG